jgi:RNA exonuclease 1
MFTSKGLFSEVVCPYPSTCVLPTCIFKHPDTTISVPDTTISSQEPVGLANGQDGQRKRQKVVDENERPHRTESELSVGSTSTGEHKGSLKSSSDEKPKRKGLAATREISPPPLRRKPFDGTSLPQQPPAAQNVKAISTPTTPKVQVAKTLVKTSLKEEGLNPRALKIPAPASHDMRFRLLRALHEQFSRLNSELARDASDKEEALVLSDQALITKALDIEEDAAATPSIYSNIVKNKILVYKRMSVKQWVDERAEEVAQAKAKEATSISDTPTAKTTGPPKVIDTGLNAHEELTLLHRLYTPITGLTTHGYVASIPTEKEIESARQGVRDGKSATDARVASKCSLIEERKMVPLHPAENAFITSASHTGKNAQPLTRRPNEKENTDAATSLWVTLLAVLKLNATCSRSQKSKDLLLF